MRTILCMNAKGGCGKTTVATNLATWYADDGKNVALADLDPQRSSLDWLAARNDYDGIPEIAGIDGVEGPVRAPRGTDVLLVDSPANAHGASMTDALRRADDLLVPVLPSPMDMRAVARYVGELHAQARINRGSTRVALIENRVRETTRIYQELAAFLRQFDIPVIGHLRDSQNYLRAAETGLGIFELAPSSVVLDVPHWDSIVAWLK